MSNGRICDISFLHYFTRLALGKVFEVHHEAVDISSDVFESFVNFVVYLGENFLRHRLAIQLFDLHVDVVSDGSPDLPESLDVQFLRELFWDVGLVIDVLDFLPLEDVIVQTLHCCSLFFDDWVVGEVSDPLYESLLGQVIQHQSGFLIVRADLFSLLPDLLAYERFKLVKQLFIELTFVLSSHHNIVVASIDASVLELCFRKYLHQFLTRMLSFWIEGSSVINRKFVYDVGKGERANSCCSVSKCFVGNLHSLY